MPHCHDQFRAWIQPNCGGGSYDRSINSDDRSSRHLLGGFYRSSIRPYRHLDRPRATGVHVERSCGALDNLLRDHDLLDALEAW